MGPIETRPAAARARQPAEVSEGAEHRVQSGDTLYGLARQYYHTVSAPAVEAIFRANEHLKDPHRLKLGQTLRIPLRLGSDAFVAVANPQKPVVIPGRRASQSFDARTSPPRTSGPANSRMSGAPNTAKPQTKSSPTPPGQARSALSRDP